jgi:beta-glucosidase
LPDDQDKLVAAVAAANPHTIVVLETGGPVTMPWIDKVSAAIEAWYPGIRGAEAIANIVFGDVNPSAKLVQTFPRSEADLPHATVFGPPPSSAPPPAPSAPGAGEPGGFRANLTPFDIPYTEGLKVGYKWYDAENKEPLFAFGHGLSYTTFAYSGLKTTPGKEPKVTFQMKNTGKRAGMEVAQVYVTLPAGTGEPPRRLVAWDKVQLAPGESKTVSFTIDPFHLSVFNVDKDAWEVVPGDYKVWVGASSRNLPLSETVKISN